LAIAVPRRSWFEISLWKTGKGRKTEKGAKEKERKRDGIQTAELDRRDQVTATNSWPNFPSSEGNKGRLSGSSTYWIEYTQLAPSDNRSTKSADGRVATEATWLNGKQFGKRRNKEERKNRKMIEKP
jgi:hypothetical protein